MDTSQRVTGIQPSGVPRDIKRTCTTTTSDRAGKYRRVEQPARVDLGEIGLVSLCGRAVCTPGRHTIVTPLDLENPLRFLLMEYAARHRLAQQWLREDEWLRPAILTMIFQIFLS